MRFGNSDAIGYRTMGDRPALWNPYADDRLEIEADERDDDLEADEEGELWPPY